MTRERVKLLFDAEIQVMLAESPFPTSMFTEHEEDYEAKMKYLYRRILNNDMKAARREDPEDLFVKKEKRSHETEDIKPLQTQKSARGENGEHIQKTVIDLEQGDGDEGWDEPFQGYPEKLNEPRRQQGGRNERMNFNQQRQRPRDRMHQSPGKQMAEILSKKMSRLGQVQICEIRLEGGNTERQDKVGAGRVIRRCDDWAYRRAADIISGY
ncbi:MAG: hypothetical protein EZS28_004715 [Streblomastix strix]|uniref:Uncharacterized protein n=1 Tax=Streblomastix strix TaxID=222440 RepID=A0A5J4WZ75_9EUKA|nr:MAG: hypothetical protein EZS28_004715 [Streblomastix strix]